jgi:hypothetical protein
VPHISQSVAAEHQWPPHISGSVGAGHQWVPHISGSVGQWVSGSVGQWVSGSVGGRTSVSQSVAAMANPIQQGLKSRPCCNGEVRLRGPVDGLDGAMASNRYADMDRALRRLEPT